jgi:DNA-binding phage protein
MSEIAKKIKDTTDPIKKQSLITDSRAVYTYLNAAFKEIDEEMKAEEEAKAND